MASGCTNAPVRPDTHPATTDGPGGIPRPALAPPRPGPTLGLPGLQDRIVLLLTNGMALDAAQAYCLGQGQDLEAARLTVAEARKRITIAADFARDEQLGKAVMRLDDIYAKSIAAKDTRTALQTQRELNRLMGLYTPKDSPDDAAPSDAQEALQRLELIASYLLPLHLTDDRYPVEEHARIASEIIRTHGV